MTHRPHISLVFAGGGTGGHLFPALAIADGIMHRLQDEVEVKILFVGTRRGIEYELKETLKYPLRLINVRGLVRSFTLKNLLVPFLLIGALADSSRILREAQPDLVIGTGGYVAWPVLRAATKRGIPTVLQEQNSYPGMVTRKCATQATKVYLGFERAKQHLHPDANTITTGNPVRTAVLGGDRDEALREFGLDPNKKTILVLGGSQGARAINQTVLEDLRLGRFDDRFQLLWQTGRAEHSTVVAAIGERAVGHRLFPFAQRMDLIYAAADFAVARAGASTLSELMANGVPSLLVPYPFAAGDHQRHNAQSMVADGFAEMVDQDELKGSGPLERVVALEASGRADLMREKMTAARAERTPAVELIVDDILGIIRQQKEKAVAG